MEQLHCHGCGVLLQSTDPESRGYIPEMKDTGKPLYCKRCFSIRHYNKLTKVDIDDNDFRKMLHTIGETDNLVVTLVDALDFNGTWVNGLERYVNGNPIHVLVNKVDLLPQSLKPVKIEHWIRRRLKAIGIKVAGVQLISAEKKHGIDEAVNEINRLRKGRNVYIVGTTNVGKSTFINALLQSYGEQIADPITTSYFPGTTLDFIEIALDDNTSLFDTPGIIQPGQLTHYLEYTDFKYIIPKKELKAVGFQLKSNQSLYVGSCAQFDIFTEEPISVTTFYNNTIKIHRGKQEKSQEFYEQHKGELLQPIQSPLPENFNHRKRYELRTNHDKTSIYVSGLGWTTIHAKNIDVSVYVPDGVDVYMVEALI
ncbi:ribosome biogenesis GTPase YqeH [Culicoidibacter larvae]|uniref:Ribosome biogenesis GTPase YqeH n=1 Tax=Culicoidibacter larvae TaxID=2579976 RepID=A0A5R8QCH9_9FIRM|nr:ribosome biogenesis GTPase YqeH [Culicoidibacter larvae]TLG74281.1 ribosome biogenesis GTPase YqeH [Culicoidibacter larvae]